MVGKELRRVRTRQGLSQEEVAFRAHISREYLGQIEREQKHASFLARTASQQRLTRAGTISK